MVLNGNHNHKPNYIVIIPMRVVKQNFLNHCKHSNLKKNPLETWKLATKRATTPFVKIVKENREWNGNKLVEQNQEDSLSEFLSVNLK